MKKFTLIIILTIFSIAKIQQLPATEQNINSTEIEQLLFDAEQLNDQLLTLEQAKYQTKRIYQNKINISQQILWKIDQLLEKVEQKTVHFKNLENVTEQLSLIRHQIKNFIPGKHETTSPQQFAASITTMKYLLSIMQNQMDSKTKSLDLSTLQLPTRGMLIESLDEKTIKQLTSIKPSNKYLWYWGLGISGLIAAIIATILISNQTSK